MDIEALKAEIDTHFNNVYRKAGLTIRDRRRAVRESITALTNLCVTYFSDEAIKYINNRMLSQDRLEKIQNIVLTNLQIILPNLNFIKSSSFSSNLYLMKTSDIDFTGTKINLSEEELKQIYQTLQKNNFIFKKIGSKGKPYEFHIFSRMYKDENGEIEIEVKIRDEKASQKILLMHTHINKMYNGSSGSCDPTYLTYLKYLLCEHQEHYDKLKHLIYEDALVESGWKGEMFGCSYVNNDKPYALW